MPDPWEVIREVIERDVNGWHDLPQETYEQAALALTSLREQMERQEAALREIEDITTPATIDRTGYGPSWSDIGGIAYRALSPPTTDTERCPTCGSDVQKMHLEGCQIGDPADPWHREPSEAEMHDRWVQRDEWPDPPEEPSDA